MVTMHTWYRIALVLVIIGALNWGLIGFFGFDLVSYIFGGQNAMASRIIYAGGIAGLFPRPVVPDRRKVSFGKGLSSALFLICFPGKHRLHECLVEVGPRCQLHMLRPGGQQFGAPPLSE